MRPFSFVVTAIGAKAVLGKYTTENFTQPVLWQDLADVELIRVDDTYYYSASTMHFSPGAPLLKSMDLVNWEYLSHSLPEIKVGDPGYDLDGSNKYNEGVYASSIAYHKKTGVFFWIGCLQYIGATLVYTATDPAGPWTREAIIEGYCFYDNGILIEDDDTFYVAYSKWIPNGNEAKIEVAQLKSDFQVETTKTVFHTTPELGYIEGARFYKIQGRYYIWLTNPGVGRGQIVLRSDDGPFGPYNDWHRVLENSGAPLPGAGPPFQGGLIDTPAGDWWYMAFVDRWPGGRLPVLAPVYWEDGWPNVKFVAENTWAETYQYPLPRVDVKQIEGVERFKTNNLGPQWEWNHNPDNSKWAAGDGLTLQTATVTDDFFMARNTLTHRILGPESYATIELDLTSMKDGDSAGLVVFRYNAGWIGVTKSGMNTTLQMVDNITMKRIDEGWKTVNKGEIMKSINFFGKQVWLRVLCDVNGSPNYSTFYYSTDGKHFEKFGSVHETLDGEVYFLGTRYGVFNYATKEIGGKVTVKSFEINLPE